MLLKQLQVHKLFWHSIVWQLLENKVPESWTDKYTGTSKKISPNPKKVTAVNAHFNLSTRTKSQSLLWLWLCSGFWWHHKKLKQTLQLKNYGNLAKFGKVKKKTIHKFLLKTLPHRYSPLQNLKHLHKSNKTQQTQLLWFLDDTSSFQHMVIQCTVKHMK